MENNEETSIPTEENSYKSYDKINSTKKTLLSDFVFKEGKTTKEAALLLNINHSSARTIISKIRKDGRVVEKIRGGNNPIKLTEVTLAKIEEFVEHNSQITIKQIRDKLLLDGTNLSISTIHRGLEKLKITFKKASRELEKVNCPTSILKRKAYAIDFSTNSPTNKQNCIFIDESGFNLHLRRNGARSRIGTRANVMLPTNRGRNVTLICAMNSQRIIHYKIVDEGTCNSKRFGEFLMELLCILNDDSSYTNAWLILDNAQIHKTVEIRNMIAGTSYTLKFLSPYSYMVNPIENAFSKIKATARRLLAENDNAVSLRSVIITGVESIQCEDCINYVLHMLNNISLAVNETIFHI